MSRYATPITSGLTPCPPGAGVLNPARAARLRDDLRRLNAARRQAAAELARPDRTTAPNGSPTPSR